MEELLETERTYINDLQWVVDVSHCNEPLVCGSKCLPYLPPPPPPPQEYMPAMDNLEELPRNLLGKKNLIFSNIPHILEFNMQ